MLNVRAFQFNQVGIGTIVVHQQEIATDGASLNHIAINSIVADFTAPLGIIGPVHSALLFAYNNGLMLCAEGAVSI